jgi:predicted lipoprotein with Yx(FWY)xxD motif
VKSLLTLATVAGALALAACGASGSSSNAAAGTSTVSTAQLDGFGNVLTDPTGKTLYTPEQEADGQVLCTGACTTFWMPLVLDAGAPTAAPGVATLGVINRPDGTRQVTEGGRPLYTFSQESPGEVKGDGFADEFGSQRFTWHAVLADGATAISSATNIPTSSIGY